jgi:hypothetical protein
MPRSRADRNDIRDHRSGDQRRVTGVVGHDHLFAERIRVGMTEPPGVHPRVFISYAHDSAAHQDHVREFATFLRVRAGIDARLDVWADDGRRRDWSRWAIQQFDRANFVIAIASPKFRERADGRAPYGEGRGVEFEGAIMRNKMTEDQQAWIRRILPVVLPGHSVAEIPEFLFPYSATHYVIESITLDGIAELHRALTGTPRYVVPKLGEPIPPAPAGLEEAAPPRRMHTVLVTSLKAVKRGSDIRFTECDIDGEHFGDSIVYRSDLFSSAPRGVVEFNLGRRYRTMEATVGVLDDATDASQIGHFQVFLDGEKYTEVSAAYGRPVQLRVDVTDVLRLGLVAYRPGTTVSPLLAGARIAGGQSNRLPELAWGNPRLLG